LTNYDSRESSFGGSELMERHVGLWRCAAVVKGGRRFSFAAMVCVGDGKGNVGIGYRKAREVPMAIEKANAVARRRMIHIQVSGETIPHQVMGQFGSAKVVLIPAAPGTGVIAGQAVRAVLDCLGIKNILTKSYGGSNNPKNLVKATLNALLKIRTPEAVAQLRNVKLNYRNKTSSAAKPQEPAATAKTDKPSTGDQTPPAPKTGPGGAQK
jgi:small subunit ribosomal protein S5